MTRDSLIDALRGFALFGVVVSNVPVLWGAGVRSASGTSLDIIVGYGTAYLITGKFLAMFSLLFGVSFGLYLRRSVERGRSPTPAYLRRMAVLFVIGALHNAFAGTDILMTYAVLGTVLLLSRGVSDGVLLIGAVLCLGLPELWSAVTEWIGYQPPPPIAPRAERLRLAAEGPYLELVRLRALTLTRWWIQFLGQQVIYLALFFLGLWAARRHLLDQPDRHRGLLRALWWGGLALAATGYAVQTGLRPVLATGPAWVSVTFGIVWQATTFIQAIAYGAGFALLWLAGARLQAVLSALSPAGRMALSNYLATSIVVTYLVVVTGTFSRIGPALAAALGVVLWAIQVGWSDWWLRRHEFGPFEWVWRRLAYGSGLPREPQPTPPA